MAGLVEQMRELLEQSPTDDTAKMLKAWREREGLSQVEAAIHLGVSVRLGIRATDGVSPAPSCEHQGLNGDRR